MNISQSVAAAIYGCHREIRAGEKLIEDMYEANEKLEHGEDKNALLEDSWGRRRQMELGVPSGKNGHRILGVAPELAASIIRAHIAHQRSELVLQCERARIQLEQEECPQVGAAAGDAGKD